MKSIVCPLYLYTDKTLGGLSRTPNLDATIISKIAGSIGLIFIPEDTKVGENEFGPLDVLDYIYAVLHSPQFREKYAEFLKFDCPKIPYPVNYEYFTNLKQFGQRLRILHTDESEPISTANEYKGQQNPIVDRPAYKKGCICVNPSGDRIINVPEHIWNMYFGGYQPLQKWLKDRRGKVLTQADVHHLQYMVFALTETYEIMREIDVAINP